ncbi:MAG: AI-2E family transporter [Anaerolineae bacterium]|nr:AI-2E family transporter [Anaerolineae bacterium]
MKPAPPMITSPGWTLRTKRVIASVVLVLMALAVLRLSEILPSVAVAAILAYLLTPLVNFIENRVLAIGPLKRRRRRGIAVLLTYIVILFTVTVVMLVIVPAIVQQLEAFGRQIPQLLRSFEASLEESLNHPLSFNGEPILINGEPFVPLQQLRDATGVEHLTEMLQLQELDLVDTTQSFIGSLTGPAFNFVGGALTAIINVIFLLSMMFFLMRDGAMFIQKGIDLTPTLYRGDVRRLLYELGWVWNAYLRGQLTLALLMGTAAFIAATLLGLPNPLILGLISGLLEFIPSIGSGLALFPAALLALTSESATIPFLEGGTFALVTVIVWAGLQNVEAIILVPRVMGGSLNLHPFVVIIAIIAGATLAGLLGIILAAPAVASLRVFGQYIYGKLMDKDPFPSAAIRAAPRPPRPTLLRQEWVNRVGVMARERLDAMRK